jgi:hypothetical protein
MFQLPLERLPEIAETFLTGCPPAEPSRSQTLCMHAVRAPGSNVTVAPEARAGFGAWK